MGFVLERARDLAVQLSAAGVPATADPAQAMGLAPCVLIGPPVQERRLYNGRNVTWRLIALASTTDPGEAWDQLDELLDALAELLPWERAEPSSYVLPTGTESVPAYAVDYSETITEE